MRLDEDGSSVEVLDTPCQNAEESSDEEEEA